VYGFFARPTCAGGQDAGTPCGTDAWKYKAGSVMARLVLRPGSGGSRDTLFVATRNAGTNLFALEMLWAFDASAVVLRHA